MTVITKLQIIIIIINNNNNNKKKKKKKKERQWLIFEGTVCNIGQIHIEFIFKLLFVVR